MITTLRSVLKRGAERVIVACGAPKLSRRLRSNYDLILAYHNIVPAGEQPGGDRSLHLSVEDFAMQLDEIIETHQVVPLAEIFKAPVNCQSTNKPRAAITFDDGYVGSLTSGLAELKRRELPATYFVCPGLLGLKGFWWDVLADTGTGELTAEFRKAALNRDCGRTEDVLDRAKFKEMELHCQPHHAGAASEDMLAEAAKTEGIRIGSHTWSHVSLDCLSQKELSVELRKSYRWLVRRYGDHVVPWLSLPYGRGGERVISEARSLGYEGIVRIAGGLAGPDSDQFAAPRVNVPAGISVEGFVLRTVGM